MNWDEVGPICFVALVALGMWFFWPDRDAPASTPLFTYGAIK
jgi:hypothetical protein